MPIEIFSFADFGTISYIMTTRKTPPKVRDVLFEMRRIGNVMRVTAIDPRTGTEVISVADPRCSMHTIKTMAAQKLAYVIEKNKKKILDQR
jgi:hypothetical protein